MDPTLFLSLTLASLLIRVVSARDWNILNQLKGLGSSSSSQNGIVSSDEPEMVLRKLDPTWKYTTSKTLMWCLKRIGIFPTPWESKKPPWMRCLLGTEMKQLQNKETEMKKTAAKGNTAEKGKDEESRRRQNRNSTKLKKQLKLERSVPLKVITTAAAATISRTEYISTRGGEWTNVLSPRKGRHARRKPKPKGQEGEEEEERQPWVSDDLEL